MARTAAPPWHVIRRYTDAAGDEVDVDAATAARFEAVLRGRGPVRPPLVVWQPLGRRRVGHGAVVLEDGAQVRVDGTLPPDLPIGYHELRLDDGGTRPLFVAPPRCALPARRGWGWAVQLYALRSGASWGIGDLGDLARFGALAGEQGARFVLVNPLSAGPPVSPLQPSPYSPSTRRFRDPLWLSLDDVPGAAGDELVAEAAARARRRNGERRLDRDAAWKDKREALLHLWERFTGDARFDVWLHERGETTLRYGTYCALAEQHGSDWRRWPDQWRRPPADAGRDAPGDTGGLLPLARFHLWLQWLLDVQLAAASRPGLVQDLPVGFDPGGFDAWEWQDLVVDDARIGAPPDLFSSTGQDWGLPPFSPPALAAAGYRPFVETVRAALRHAAGLRVDHVMGLFRQWWVPNGESPASGAYVRLPSDHLLAVLAIESVRAGAFVVGEDLGTVEPQVRPTMARRGLLSYRLLWFEDEPPSSWPRRSLGAVTTHDLPTIGGVVSGHDLSEQRALGLDPDPDAVAGLAKLLPDDVAGDVTRAVRTAAQLLARGNSLLVAMSLDDALEVAERPNMPGADAAGRANWSLGLPVAVEDLAGHDGVAAVARAMAGRSAHRSPAVGKAR